MDIVKVFGNNKNIALKWEYLKMPLLINAKSIAPTLEPLSIAAAEFIWKIYKELQMLSK